MRITHESIIYLTPTFECITSVKVILDTDAWKDKAKNVYERMGDINEVIDDKINKVTGRIVDLFG